MGRFAEVELIATPDTLAEMQSKLLTVAARLGLGVAERRSYLELLLTNRGEL